MQDLFPGLKRAFSPPGDVRNVVKEIDAELAFHFECTVNELRQSGLSQADALEEASRRFGDLLRHRRRLTRTRSRMERAKRRRNLVAAVGQTAGDSLKSALRRPGLTAAIALIFTLGIGANSIMFDVFERLLQSSSHLSEPQELRIVSLRGPSEPLGRGGLQALSRLESVQGAASVNRVSATLGQRETATVSEAGLVSRGFFSLLGVQPFLGRFFRSFDHSPSAPRRAVISYSFWRRHFPQGESPLHANVLIAGRSYRIIGVAHLEFTGLEWEAPSLWLPSSKGTADIAGLGLSGRLPGPHAGVGPPSTALGGAGSLDGQTTVLRLKARADSAETRLNAMWALSTLTLGGSSVTDLTLVPVSEHFGNRSQGRLSHWMSRLSLMMLVLACANAASLLLARGLAGRYEAGVRKALGISGRRLFVQLLTEPVLLAFLGGLGAVALTYWAGHLSRSFLAPDLPWPASPLHPRLLLFTLGVSVLTGLAAGILPAIFISRQDSLKALKSQSADSGRNSRLQIGLVGTQCALSLLLLVAAGLFTTSLSRAHSTDLGFDHGKVAAFKLEYSPSVASDPARARQLAERVRRSLQAHQRLRAVSFSTSLPFYRLQLHKGAAHSPANQGRSTFTHYVDESFFSVMGVTFLSGRPPGFQFGGPSEVVISESLARRNSYHAPPLGRCLNENSPGDSCWSIVGVVPDMRLNSLSGRPPLQYFLPLSQYPDAIPHFLLLRLGERRPGLVEGLRRTVLAAAPQLKAVHIIPLDKLLERELKPWRSAAKLFAFFAVMALLVAMLGLYSVLSLNVAGRRRELGIRAVLGARADNQLALIFGEAFRLSWAGIGAGVIIALGAAGPLQPLLFKTSARHPLVLTAAVVLLLSSAAIAAFIPAWRAARIDPCTALRD